MDDRELEDSRTDEDRKVDAYAFLAVFTALILGIAHWLSGWTFDI